jgi:hypothetical protein
MASGGLKEPSGFSMKESGHGMRLSLICTVTVPTAVAQGRQIQCIRISAN